MHTQDQRWLVSILIAVVTIMISVGWLDVVRGRQLAIQGNDIKWAIEEIVRLHEDVERLKREHREQWRP